MQLRLLMTVMLLMAGTACSGSDGATGAPGADGKDGAKGATGAKGADGKDGTDGEDGANGKDGANGNDGTDGKDGSNGNDIILSETARVGLKLSEVEVDLSGLDSDEIESVGRGSYLINAVGDCKGCHNSPDGKFLAGNNNFPIGGFKPDDPTANCNVASPPSGCVDGHVFTRNLTPDPITGMKLTEAQFIEALRTGRDFKDATGGTTLMVMPWAQLRWLTTEDLRDMYAYLTHIPAVANAVLPDVKPVFPPPPSPFYDTSGEPVPVPTFSDGDKARPLPAAFDPALMKPTTEAGEVFDYGNSLRGLAISPLNDDSLVTSLSAQDQQLYGRGSYIVNGPGLCNECHTAGGRDRATNKVRTSIFLTGGQAFAVPPPLYPVLKNVRTVSANLTGASHGFKLGYSTFVDSLLSGLSFTKAPAAPYPLGFPMPFDVFRNMSNGDKLAVYTYISTIQKNAASLGIAAGDVVQQAPSRYCTVATQAADCTGSGETCDATTSTCVGGACAGNADCGACQTCSGTNTCVAESPTSACVLTSL
ncbi:MAG: hypothetical protein WDO74_28095 [Pseudomonadota bacterium]